MVKWVDGCMVEYIRMDRMDGWIVMVADGKEWLSREGTDTWVEVWVLTETSSSPELDHSPLPLPCCFLRFSAS